MATKFDELNKLTVSDFETWDELNEYVGMNRSLPFKQYFGEMGIGNAEKRRRGVFAEKLEDDILFLLAFLFYMTSDAASTAGATELIDKLKETYIKAYGVPDIYILTRVEQFATDIVLTVMKHPDEPYYYSGDRARLLAEEEANTAVNHAEYEEALKSGFTYKTWCTMQDERVREAHVVMDGVTVPINAPFEVGDCLMLYPRDESLGATADLICGCRCWVEFS